MAGISATRCPGCFNLFLRSYVRFRQFYLLFGACNLALVSLLYSFVHNFTLHPRALLPCLE